MIKAETNEGRTTENLSVALTKVKTELGNNKKNLLIEKIKNTVIEHVYYSEKQIKTNFSDYLNQKLDYHYTYMANLFSKVHGSSIQNFIIKTKIERVKELLIYEDMTLTAIAAKLHYSSVAHLSNQFKKVTGLSPSQFIAANANTASLLPHNFPRVFHTYTDDSQEKESVILPLNPPQAANNSEGNLKQMEG